MADNRRQRDLEDTDVYDVGMFPAAPAQRLGPPIPPASQQPTATGVERAPVAPGAPTPPLNRGAAAPATQAPPAVARLRAAPPPAYHPAAPSAPGYRPTYSVPPAAAWPADWRPPYDTSGLAVLSATVLLVLGIVGAIAFAFMLAVWDALARLNVGFGELSLASIESTRTVIITLLVVSLVQIASSIGVFAHRSWGRLLGIAISVPGIVLGTLLAVAAVTRGPELEAWLAGLLLAAYAITFFGLIAGSSHFRRMARRF